MRLITRAFFVLLVLAGPLSAALPLQAQAGEGGYRLLELDGYTVKWGKPRLGERASISYAFASEQLTFKGARNCGELAPVDKLLGQRLSKETLAREAAAAFRVWERAAGLEFREVADAREADIILGAQGQPRGQAFANVSYAPNPKDGVRAIQQALVCLNPEHSWKIGFDGNEDVYDIRYTLIHEIGHAIGLDHPGRTGQVMAFRYSEAFSELQPGDLRGVQRLYGPAENDVMAADRGDPHSLEGPLEAAMCQVTEATRAGDDPGDFLAIGSMDATLPWDYLNSDWKADNNGSAGSGITD